MKRGITRTDVLVCVVVVFVAVAVLGRAAARAKDDLATVEKLDKARAWSVTWQQFADDHGGLMAMPSRPVEKWGDLFTHSWKDSTLDYGVLDNDGRYSSHDATDDPQRDCRETVFGTVSPYVESADAFTLQSDAQPFNSTWGKAPYHDLIGWYGGACSSELGSAPCWWQGGEADSEAHCAGWDVGYAPGSAWWYPGAEHTSYTLEQWRTNSVGNNGVNRVNEGWDFAGPMRHMTKSDWYGYQLVTDYYASGTAGPDGLLMTSAMSEVENGTDNVAVAENGYLEMTAANVSGEARVFRLRRPELCMERERHSLHFMLSHVFGWNEAVEWAEGNHAIQNEE